MTTIALENLLIVLFAVAALATVCRLAYRVAGGLLDPQPVPRRSAAVEEAERLAA